MGTRKKALTGPTTTPGATTRCTGLAETGDLLYLGLREGYRHTSYGMKEVLPGTIERVGKHCIREQRLRADSGYYSQALVRICEEREVEYPSSPSSTGT